MGGGESCWLKKKEGWTKNIWGVYIVLVGRMARTEVKVDKEPIGATNRASGIGSNCVYSKREQ